MKKRIVTIVVLALLIGTGLFVYYGQQKVRKGELFYSGTIEATQSHLAFQTGGRVLGVLVREGEAVAKDQLLAELDQAEFARSQIQAYGADPRLPNSKGSMRAIIEPAAGEGRPG